MTDAVNGGHGEHGHNEHGHDHGSDHAVRTEALESLLAERGHVFPAATDELLSSDAKVGHRRGAEVVARAWSDPAFLDRLRANARDAVAEMGYSAEQGAEFVAVENTDDVHNVIVCTLCSCYPAGLLGLAPNWYKDNAYRSRVVIEPREVLAEFGVHVPDETEVRVWDSTAELRYMVIPKIPDGAENLSIEDKIDLISRNALIGTAFL